MNWLFWAIIVFTIYTIGTLAFFSVYGYIHPKKLMEPKPTRWRSKIEQLIEKFGKVFGYMLAFIVVMYLLFGIALLIWAIVEIAKAL